MEPHRGVGIPLHGLVIWDGWVLMLPGVFAALVLATALALNGPGEALWAWVQAQLAPDPWRARWDDAVLRHRATAQAFAEVECDLSALLRLPALADVEQPATARFIDAFAEANALHSEQFPGPVYAQKFVEAAERAERAWAAAVEVAERKGDSRFAGFGVRVRAAHRLPAGATPARRARARHRVAAAPTRGRRARAAGPRDAHGRSVAATFGAGDGRV